MTESFFRPLGVHADVAELEYISALHQSSPTILQDGSISAEDISNYLVSRHGIVLNAKEVRSSIMKGFGGGDEESECLDISETVAILLIPYLVKVSYQVLPEKKINQQISDDFETEQAYKDYLSKKLISEKLKPQKPEVIQEMLSVLLFEATGDTNPQRLDEKLLKDIFLSFGEYELAEDEYLIKNMISMLRKNNEEIILDSETFMRALVSDVDKVDINKETCKTTFFYDVFETDQRYKTMTKITENRDLESNSKRSSSPVESLSLVFTASSIDTQADTSSSQTLSILLWVNLIFTYFAYLLSSNATFWVRDCSALTRPFSCYLTNALVKWIVVLGELSVFGTIYICYGNLGNGRSRSLVATLLSMTAITLCNIVPFFVDIDESVIFMQKADYRIGTFVVYASLILGFVILSLQLFNYLISFAPKEMADHNPIFSFFLISQTTKYEFEIKQAAAFKVNKMVRNALSIHHAKEEENDDDDNEAKKQITIKSSLLKFVKMKQEEECIGFFWLARKILDRTLFIEEGVWYSSRLKACLLSIFVTAVICALSCVEILDVIGISWSVVKDGTYDDKVIFGSIITGCSIGVLFNIRMTLIFLPSIASTILQYRCGVIPTFRDVKEFARYRIATDTVVSVLPSIFWGQLYSSYFISAVFGCIIFLSLSTATMNIISRIWAGILSFFITFSMLFTTLFLLRKNVHQGFFRTSPWVSNFMHVFLGSWAVGTAVGFMLVRVLKLTVITMLYVGRLDVSLLTSEASTIGPLRLEAAPDNFKKDILVHEAHRHPYMETLGQMYLMKLRYGNEFARTSGSCWRLLFVFALMPWLRKYRLLTRPQLQQTQEKQTKQPSSNEENVDYIMNKSMLSSRKLSINSNASEFQNILNELDNDIIRGSSSDDIHFEIDRLDEQIRILVQRKNELKRNMLM